MEELLRQILEESKKTNEAIQEINSKLENNERFQELVVRQFGELDSKLYRTDLQLDKLIHHANRHHDELELVAIQIRALQREPNKNDVGEYFAKKKFSLVMED